MGYRLRPAWLISTGLLFTAAFLNHSGGDTGTKTRHRAESRRLSFEPLIMPDLPRGSGEGGRGGGDLIFLFTSESSVGAVIHM